MTISRILVPTDFSPDADAAFAYALELANALGASVDLLHVVEDPMAAGVWSSPMYTAAVTGLQINLVRDAKEQLRRCVPMIAGVRFGVFRHVLVGNPAVEIVEMAHERASDLVVMGTAGRSGLSHLLAGSVAERVVRTAPCPVLTVKSKHAYEAADQTRAAAKASA